MCINAANYAPLLEREDGLAEIEVTVAVSETFDLILSNAFDSRGGRFPRIGRDEWISWPDRDTDGGGLYYSALALDLSGTGTPAFD